MTNYNAQEFVFVKSSVNSISQYVELYKRCFPKNTHLSADYLHWLYAKNPVGLFVGADAIFDGRVIGQVAAIPGEYILHGKPTKGLLALNVAVDPAFQGRHLFKNLGLKMCELGAAEGYEFVIGVANSAATPGWVRHMGFQLVGPLDARIGFGSLGIRFSETYKALQFQHKWSAKSLAWRCTNPRNPVLHRRDNGKTDFYAPSVGNLLPVYTEMQEQEISLPTKLSRKRFSPFRLFIGLIPGFQWPSKLYVNIPQSLRPSPLNFVYRSLTNRVPQLEKGNIFFSFLDFDAY